MGERRPPRATQKLGTEELERMARVSTEDGAPGAPDEGWSVAAQGSGATGEPLTSRTTTVSDPLTMALLAEVARSSQTLDFDPAKLEELAREVAGAPLDRKDDEAPAPHPHLKRR